MKIKLLVNNMIFVLLLFGVNSYSQAASVTYGTSWSFSSTPGDGFVSQNQLLDSFDPSLGTLTQVDWSVNASLAAHFVLPSGQISYDYEFIAAIGCGIGTFGCDGVQSTQSDTASGFVTSITGSGTPTLDKTINLDYFGGYAFTLPGDLNFFTGTSPWELELNTMTSVSAQACFPVPGDPNYCFSLDDRVVYDGAYEGGFSVTYTYTPAVPVPAAVWLFGSGLLGLVAVARRKK